MIVVIDNYDSFTYNLCQVRQGGRVAPAVFVGAPAPARARCGNTPPHPTPHPLKPNNNKNNNPQQQYLGDLGVDLHVIKNDELTVEQVRALKPCGVLVSPGPGCPVESGISLQAVRELGPDFPLFGVCMGHQCIGEAFGG